MYEHMYIEIPFEDSKQAKLVQSNLLKAPLLVSGGGGAGDFSDKATESWTKALNNDRPDEKNKGRM